jgi:filamentous hemagglutinin
MNKHAFRLIFSRRLCMWLAVSEVSHGQGKKAKTRSTSAANGAMVAAAVALASSTALAQSRPPITFASKLPAPTFNLPQPYTKVFNAPGAPSAARFVNDPSLKDKVNWTVDGKTATFNQGNVPRVILNWDSFDIGAGYTVRFVQDPDPTKYVSALNRVWSTQPSVIQGSLEANREVMLVNNQGVYFGSGARVNAGRFVASTNSVSDAVFEKGIRNVVDGSVVFSTAGTDHLPTNLNSAISVEPGAQISSAAGGDVLLVAPRVSNKGRIETPAGQSILAAGDKVYLMSSSDPAQRGLIVAVDPITSADGRNDAELGVVENAADGKTVASAGLVQKINEIRANSGTVNLVGLTVRQNGVINATTAVKGANGAIYLQAMASTVLLDATTDPLTNPNSETLRRGWLVEPSSQVRAAAELGTVQVGANSVTAVRPDTSSATQLDAEVFNQSRIRVEGRAITLASGSQVVAPGGRIELLGAETAIGSGLFDTQVPGFAPADDSRIVVASGALVSAAGLRDVAVDGARNQGALRLFRIELSDAPVQRSTPLYRSQVYFDLRDGSKITSANVSGASSALARTAEERSTRGGSIAVATDGRLVVAEAAQLDVSGGSLQYSATTIKNSLLEQDGRVVTFRASAAGSPVSKVLADSQSTPVPAYQEGADGGALSVSARSAELRGRLVGTVVTGELQRVGRSKAATAATLQIGRNAAADYDFAKLTLRNAPRAPLAPLDPRLFSDNALADLPALPVGLDLYLDGVSAGSFGKLLLRGSEVSQPEFGTLNLGPGGELDVLANKRLDLNGAFIAPGGRITVRSNAGLAGTGDVQLSSATRLDAAGRWYNDTAGAGSSETSAAGRSINGGQVTVTAPNNLTLQSGAVIDVSAGAALNAAGTLTRGSAGSVALSGGRATTVGQFGGLSLTGAELRGFGFASGGKLNLNAQNLRIANDNAPGFTLAPAFFSAGGFESINVNAFGDVRLASGITLTPQLRTWQFGDGWRQAPSGAMSDAVVIADLTDTQLSERNPVSVSFSATRPLFTGGANVVVERGAKVLMDPGASLVLNATGSIDVGQSGGSVGQRSMLSAPGGVVSLNVLGDRGGNLDADPVGFLGSQAIWLGSEATLSTSGIAQTRRDGAAASVSLFNSSIAPATPQDQRVTGKVLGGGTVTLNAQRGYIVAQPGAVVSLNGATAELNFAGLAQAVTVAKPAGNLNVFSPEGIFWDASVSAQAPRNAAGRALADGGGLNLSLAGNGVLPREGTDLAPYPTAGRTLVIGSEAELLRLRNATLGTDLSTALGNGNGLVNSALCRPLGLIHCDWPLVTPFALIRALASRPPLACN